MYCKYICWFVIQRLVESKQFAFWFTMWLQSVDPVVCRAQLVTGDAATDTFRLKLLQYRARCYLVTHAVKACKREIKSLITAGGPVSGEKGEGGQRQTDMECSVVMNSYSFGISLHHNLLPTEKVFARLRRLFGK